MIGCSTGYKPYPLHIFKPFSKSIGEKTKAWAFHGEYRVYGIRNSPGLLKYLFLHKVLISRLLRKGRCPVDYLYLFFNGSSIFVNRVSIKVHLHTFIIVQGDYFIGIRQKCGNIRSDEKLFLSNAQN